MAETSSARKRGHSPTSLRTSRLVKSDTRLESRRRVGQAVSVGSSERSSTRGNGITDYSLSLVIRGDGVVAYWYIQ